MSEDMVKIKGVKRGLLLQFASDAEFEKIEENLKNKLISGFFTRGTPVFLKPDILIKEHTEVLKRLFSRYGLIFKIEDPEIKEECQEEIRARVPHPIVNEEMQNPQVVPEAKEEKAEEMLVINKTLRGGQEIRTKSSVLVCGNVNPGAQIIAGGSIDVRGKCLGMVHAGAYGNKESVIIADCLSPTQIRIANLVARAPDEGDFGEKAERASIKDGQIVIEPIER